MDNNVDCNVESAEELDWSKTTEFFGVSSLDEMELYCICADSNEIPLVLNNNIILLYTDQSKAEHAAEKIAKNYVENTIQATKIKDLSFFFAAMSYVSNMMKFCVDGQGAVTRFSGICSKETADKLVSKEEVDYLLEEMQFNRPARSPQVLFLHKNVVKEKKGIDFYLGLISLICSIASICLFILIGYYDGIVIASYLLSLLVGIVTGTISIKKSADKLLPKRTSAQIGAFICGAQIILLLAVLFSDTE